MAIQRSVTATVALLAVAFGAAGVTSAAHGPAHGSLTNIQVSRDHYVAHAEPFLAVNPHNPRNLLGVATVHSDAGDDSGIATFASFDGGLTWHGNRILAMPHGYSTGIGATVAFNANGIGFVAAAAGNETPSVVLCWRTADGGRNFTRPVTIAGGPGGSAHVEHPWLAVDPTRRPHGGLLYLTWSTGESTLEFTRSTDGGRTFSRPRAIRRLSNAFLGMPVVAVGPQGRVYVVYAAGPLSMVLPMKREVLSSSDQGRSFGVPRPIATAPPSLALGSLIQLNAQALAIDPRDGTLYVAMAVYRPHTHDTDILLRQSRNGGRTWSTPVRVNDDRLTDRVDHFQPQLGVTARGTVFVSYFADAGGRIDVCLSWSTTHGASFQPSRRMTTVSFPAVSWLGDYQGLALGANAVHLVWNGTRKGRLEIFTAAAALV